MRQAETALQVSLLLLQLLSLSSGNVSECGKCLCDGKSIVCNFATIRHQLRQTEQLAHLIPSAQSLLASGLQPTSYTELFIRCDNIAAFRGQQINSSLLKAFTGVVSLSIIQCGVESMSGDAFSAMSQLRKVNLNENRLRQLPPQLLAGKKILQLQLSDNPGIRLLPQTFSSVASINEIVMSRCDLREFPVDSLLAASGLKSLTLSSNAIRFVPKRAKRLLASLATFYLDSNPIVCTCANRWLLTDVQWSTISKPIMMQQKQPQCAQPAQLSGKLLSDLSADQLRCSAPLISDVEVEVAEESLLLRCRAESELPQPLRWSLKGDNFADADVRGNATFERRIRRSGRAETLALTATAADGQSANFSLHVSWPLPPAAATTERPKQQPKLLEAQRPTLAAEAAAPTQPANYFSRKQFSLADMIIAVIGTFVTTLVLFLASYQLTRWCNRREKQRWAMYNSHTGTSACGYMQQRPVSHDYDVPRCDQPCIPKPPPPPPPMHSASLQPLPPSAGSQPALEFVDYSGRRLVYAR